MKSIVLSYKRHASAPFIVGPKAKSTTAFQGYAVAILILMGLVVLPSAQAGPLHDAAANGDFNQVTVEEALKLMAGDASGRVAR